MLKSIKVCVAGQSNVGKTSLVNNLTGACLKVGNFSGTTVEIQEVATMYNNICFTFIDTPGITCTTSESCQACQAITKDAQSSLDTISNPQLYDIVLWVTTQQNLVQSIALLKSICLPNKPIVIYITDGKQERLPIGTTIVFSQNKQNLLNTIKDEFDKNLTNLPLPNIFSLTNNELATILADYMSKKTAMQERESAITKSIDKVLMNKFFAFPSLVGALYTMFYSTFVLSDPLSNAIENTLAYLGNQISQLSQNKSSFFVIAIFALTDGILPAIGTVLSFLPKVIIMFVWISIFEQTGYLVRVGASLSKFLKIFGLAGESIVSLIGGFGCSIPAYISTRIIPSKSARFSTLIATSFIPCHAKMIVFVFLVSAFFPKHPALAITTIYTCGILMALIFAKLASKTFAPNKSDEPMGAFLSTPMPNYKIPDFKNIFMSVKARCIEYTKGTFASIGLIAFAIWATSHIPYNIINTKYYKTLHDVAQNPSTANEKYLTENSLLGMLGKKASFVFRPLGLDWKLTVSLLSSLTAKETCIGTIGALYHNPAQPTHQTFGQEVSIASGVSYIVIILAWLPCTSAIATLIHEHKNKRRMTIMVFANSLIAWLLGFFAYNITKLL